MYVAGFRLTLYKQNFVLILKSYKGFRPNVPSHWQMQMYFTFLSDLIDWLSYWFGMLSLHC